MQQTDFQRFKALMNGMAKLYERELDGPVLDAYWLALRNWELADFEAGAAHLMRTSTFMPRPADFETLRKAGRPTAGEAWASVLASVRAGYSRWTGGGVSRDPSFTPPDNVLIDRAVQAIGGYDAIGMSNRDQTPFLERRFCEHYDAIRDAEEVRQEVPAIAAQGSRSLEGPRPARDLLPRRPS
jgi:hypothetical protein